VFYVKTTGRVFDMKYYGKLFGVFQRFTRRRSSKARGVGLAISTAS